MTELTWPSLLVSTCSRDLKANSCSSTQLGSDRTRVQWRACRNRKQVFFPPISTCHCHLTHLMLPFALPTFISFTYVLTSIFGASINSHVNAQSFRPVAVTTPCSTFVEGQGLYILGGAETAEKSAPSIDQAFMIDLSVSWNASNPVIRKLEDGPGGFQSPCTMTSDNEGIFMLVLGNGYMYNLKSDSWRMLTNNAFPIDIHGSVAVTDPESGLIYVVNGSVDFDTTGGYVMELDPKTRTVNTIPMPEIKSSNLNTAAWNSRFRSMVFMSASENELYTFTPSERSKPSLGWKELNTTGNVQLIAVSPCLVPAYGGSKMVLFAIRDNISNVYVLDVATLTWTKSSPILGIYGSACGVSGDQLIIWGGTTFKDNATDKTLVYDIKAEAWMTTYTAPSLSTPTSNNGKDVKLITIIVVATVALLMVIMMTVFLFHRRTNRLDQTSLDDPTSDLSDVKHTIHIRVTPLSKGASRPRDPTYDCPNLTDVDVTPPTERKWHRPRLSYQAYQDFDRDHSLSNHPHAIAEKSAKEYNVQGGSLGTNSVSQYPHAPFTWGTATGCGDKAEIQ
ncbi:hypothetical protein B0O80DRAFT_433321 [Mortierella sp. GBAus27b]|nr:hypothetical protein B0O80DRAFT_433321 [Mortierella sp. GBAus27b]